MFIESLFFNQGRPKCPGEQFRSLSLREKGVLFGEHGQIALDHCKAGITTEDFVQSVRHSILGELSFALEESLLLARVENDDAWHFTLLELKDAAEFGLCRHVQSHEHERDTTLDLASECILNVKHSLDDAWVRLAGFRDGVDNAENTILLKADIVCALYAEEGDGF